MTNPKFHLAFHVQDLKATQDFYCQVLGAKPGRQSDNWVDLDLYGHQLSAHLLVSSPGGTETKPEAKVEAKVDDDLVPIPHFGLVLPFAEWQALANQVESANWSFLLAPKIRFLNQPGEQGTFFIRDPSGNALEFKGFKDFEQVFAQS